MTRVVLPMFGLLLLVLAAFAIVSIPLNETHIKERGHTQALDLLPAYQSGVCKGKWVGYNIATGIVMVACGIPNTNECLVVSYRVTENAGATVLVEEAYNTTAYVDLCSRVYTRQGFVGWSATPVDLKAAITSAFGAP